VRTVGCEYAVVAREVYPWAGHQCGELGQKVQRLEHDVRGAVVVASDIKTTNASVRAGRRLFFKSGTLLSPFFGINYLDIDTRVQGITSLADAFPDGDSINVRYDIQLENDDKYAGAIGLTAGFTNGTSIVFEWNKSANSERYLFSGTVRY